jgi:mono/diheme cytochrome c family protein
MIYSSRFQKSLGMDREKAMRSAKSLSVLAVITFFTLACGEAGTNTTDTAVPANSPVASLPTATPDPLTSARINFQKNCADCHGGKGEGGLKEVEGKRFKVPSLREGHALNHKDEKFVVQISEGDDEMPAFKDKLTAQEINDLIRFIRKEFQGK